MLIINIAGGGGVGQIPSTPTPILSELRFVPIPLLFLRMAQEPSLILALTAEQIAQKIIPLVPQSP